MLFDGCVVPVEDVRVGDLLMGPDNRPRRVMGLARGREMLYRVTPRKGESYVVNESHVLSLKRTGVRRDPKYPCQVGVAVVSLSVREYLARGATFKHEHKGWRVALDFGGRQALPLDPYFLGLWLGDGDSHRATITSGDFEVREYLGFFAQRHGVRLRVEPNSANSVKLVLLEPQPVGRAGGRIANHLRSIRVLKNKHIPHVYKTADRACRLQLLAGLLDSDGHYTGKGYALTLKNETLLDDAIFVARSLGFAAYKKSVTKTCGNNGAVGTYWTCNISGDVDQIPCLVKRKQAKPRKQKKDVLVTGITVDAVGEGDYFGFEISGDGLFVLGDFTVTHNTFVFSRIVGAFDAPACVVAHRGELVTQMSVALAREGVRHRVIGPMTLRRACTSAHIDRLGADYVNPNARTAVASVDTLINLDPATPWLAQVGLWVMDEAHHVLASNKWGKACVLFPNAFGLGVTATPTRADGKGLGRHADGLMDAMVVGPTMRDLIERSYLSDYRVFAPPSDIDLSSVTVTETGDYSPPKLRDARRRSHITGDVVQHYLRIAPGKLGVTFDVDIESATETAAAYRAAGVAAEVVTSKTEPYVRARVLRRFEAREIQQLVNVDLFGEGFDVPGIEVVSMARPTQSYALYAQQFGRALRPLAGKTHAIIIDHVGNVVRHGLPDARRNWTLDRRERRSRSSPSDAIPVRTCLNVECLAVYERVLLQCPYCGHAPEPAGRSTPEQVDGDLAELDPAVLRVLRGEVARIDRPAVVPPHTPFAANASIIRRHEERQVAHGSLRNSIALWGGWNHSLGRSDREGHRRFFHAFGIDVLSAQTLGATEAAELEARVRAELNRHNVREL